MRLNILYMTVMVDVLYVLGIISWIISIIFAGATTALYIAYVYFKIKDKINGKQVDLTPDAAYTSFINYLINTIKPIVTKGLKKDKNFNSVVPLVDLLKSLIDNFKSSVASMGVKPK